MAYLYYIFSCCYTIWIYSWICMQISFVYYILNVLFFFKGVLMIIDYCLAGTPKDDLYNIPDDSRDTEDLVSENYEEEI